MKYDETLIDDWLAGRNPESLETIQEVWDPGFEADRQVVLAKFGPYNRLFEKPENYVKRFYHRIFPLTIEDWKLNFKTVLYGGFCTINSDIEIRYQSTVRYAQGNRETLENIQAHIKTVFNGLIRDLVEKELLDLDEQGSWVHTGLSQVEKRIMNAVNEAFILQKIHCRTTCILSPVFSELPEKSELDAGFIQESIYLNVMKRNHAFRETQKQEVLRQQEKQEKLKIEQQRIELEKAVRQDKSFREKQALEAEQKKRQIEEKEQQLSEQFRLEERMQTRKSEHELRMKEIQGEAEIHAQERLRARQEKVKVEDFKQKQLIKAQEQLEEIEELENHQDQWQESKERLLMKKLEQEQRLEQISLETELKNQELRQIEHHKLQERLHAEKLKHESRLKGMELEMEVKDHEKRYETSEQTSEYLRREIELLVLEKQRIELNRAVKNSDTLIAIGSDN